MIWNPNKECMSREEMRALQGKRLQKLVNYVYHNVPSIETRCRLWTSLQKISVASTIL